VLVLLAVASIFAPPIVAQSICAVIDPNPAAPGSPVTITVIDASGLGFSHAVGCVATTIHSGMPNGPILTLPYAPCGPGFSFVPATGNATKTETLPASLAPGLYYWKVETAPGTSTTLGTEWIPFTTSTFADPLLFPQALPQVGQPFVMDLAWIFGAFQPYIAAASLTTNSGINAGSLFVSLDPDVLFFLSFPVPDPLLFANFQGTLGISGTAFGLVINIPPIPALANLPLHVQAAIGQSPGLPTRLSNVVNACIAP
jgi:hypothetical protein